MDARHVLRTDGGSAVGVMQAMQDLWDSASFSEGEAMPNYGVVRVLVYYVFLLLVYCVV